MSFFLDDPTDHPDTLELEIAGKRIFWLLNKEAFEQAEEEGIDFAAFQSLEDDDVTGNLDALAALLYVGTIPFGAEITRQDFDDVLTPRLASELGPRVMAQFEGLEDEEVEAAVGKA